MLVSEKLWNHDTDVDAKRTEAKNPIVQADVQTICVFFTKNLHKIS